ncbi:MAG: MATE family efflux transporter [Clostridia bacterium]
MENNLGRDDIKQLVWRIALPSMLAQFVSVLYSIVDRMYIGHIPGIGDLALAGVGVCGPVLTMIGSVASLVGVGGAPRMSICMGEGDDKSARAILANCFMLIIGFSLALIAVMIPLREPMLRLFGASEQTLPFASEYFWVYMTGTVFALLATGLNSFVVAQGYARKAMASVVLGAVLNILLDPLFIFTLGMNVKGAALATVLSQMASCAYVLHFLLGRQAQIPITFAGYSKKVVQAVLSLGFTPFAIIAVDNVMIIAMNAVLKQYGGARGDMLITCATIVQSFMLVVTMPLGGISAGTQAILAYNYGARKTQRVLDAQRRIFGLCIGYTFIMFVLANVAGPLFVRLFTTDVALAEKATWAIRVCTIALVPLGVQYEVIDGFTAVGQVRYALPLSFWRKLVYFVALFILPAAFGAEAAFYAEPISDVLGPLGSAVIHALAMKKILERREMA